ncbi:presqualene diphosphate synthase HpnD [Rhodoligotrophos defluvii]|uniref:presqualene diphosphate synthase HpnD n=1 Tax=Rhodoligotrophos defluvii TaxID=2561934 RepID=UPI0010C9EA1D|nr:presqualene diphosphate synthase HpnD [Rhodoligotrophos defluvii]
MPGQQTGRSAINLPDEFGEASRAQVEAVVRNASSSFFWAMRILPRAKREAIFAVYAFCRNVDDIADEEAPLDEKRAGLDAWRGQIDALYGDGRLDHPLAKALAGPVRDYGLMKADFEAVIDGMAMDAGEPIFAPSSVELDLYCDRVACAVGRLCVHIFGEPNARGRAVADALGRALQLTNILRDVHEDAERGRLYLPRELLDRHGITAGSAQAVVRHPAYPALWRDLARRAEEAFVRSREALKACDRRKMRPARIMMEVYQRDLTRMMALPDRDLADPRVSKRRVGKGERLLIALRYAIL